MYNSKAKYSLRDAKQNTGNRHVTCVPEIDVLTVRATRPPSQLFLLSSG